MDMMEMCRGRDNGPNVPAPDGQGLDSGRGHPACECAGHQHALADRAGVGSLWEGVYWSGLETRGDRDRMHGHGLRTHPKECYEDAPVLYGPESYTNGSPPAIITKLADKPSNEASVPASLRW